MASAPGGTRGLQTSPGTLSPHALFYPYLCRPFPIFSGMASHFFRLLVPSAHGMREAMLIAKPSFPVQGSQLHETAPRGDLGPLESGSHKRSTGTRAEKRLESQYPYLQTKLRPAPYSRPQCIGQIPKGNPILLGFSGECNPCSQPSGLVEGGP